MRFDFIMTVSLLSYSFSFSFGLEYRVSLFGGFHCPPVNGYSTASWDFGVFAREDEHTSFYTNILNQSISLGELSLQSWVLEIYLPIYAIIKTLKTPMDCKVIQPVHFKGDQSWVFFGRNDAEAETPVLWPLQAELTHWKRLWCWEGLGAGGEGDDRGWDGWMASPTRWMWVWVNSRSWWWTGRPGVLRFMGSQRVRHDWATELNWTEHSWF